MDQNVITLAAAYVSGNKVAVKDLPDLLQIIQQGLKNLEEPVLVPAVSIDQSVGDDYLICLEDGERVTLLRRHLKARYGMTDLEYIEKWGLPEDYPFVPKSYSSRRSSIAKENRLGQIK